MKCLDCGFNNPSTATVCKGCNGPLDRKVASLIHRHSSVQEQLDLSVWTADFEAKRYGLEPKRHDESPQAFIDRINAQKTPWVCAEHTRIRGLQEERLKLQVKREPGTDDDKQSEVAA